MITAVAVCGFLAIQAPVEWSAPPNGCSRPPMVDRLVATALEDLTTAEREDVAVAVRVDPAEKEGVTIEVRVTHRGRTMSRVLTVAHCGLVTEALALIVSLAVSPLGEGPSSSPRVSTSSEPDSAGSIVSIHEPQAAVTSLPESPRSAFEARVPVEGHPGSDHETIGSSVRRATVTPVEGAVGVAPGFRPARRRIRPPRLVIGVSGGVRVGYFGPVSGGVGLAVGPRWAHFRMDVGVQYGPASVLRSLDLEGGGVEIATWVGQLVAGPVFPATRQFAFSVEGVVDAGALRVASFGVENPRAVSRPWVTLGVGATAHWSVLRWLSLTLSVEGAWAPLRHLFVLGEDARPLARTTQWGGRFRVGTEFRLF